MIEDNDKKPMRESEIDINELLRRYLPEEYPDQNEDAKPSDKSDSETINKDEDRVNGSHRRRAIRRHTIEQDDVNRHIEKEASPEKEEIVLSADEGKQKDGDEEIPQIEFVYGDDEEEIVDVYENTGEYESNTENVSDEENEAADEIDFTDDIIIPDGFFDDIGDEIDGVKLRDASEDAGIIDGGENELSDEIGDIITSDKTSEDVSDGTSYYESDEIPDEILFGDFGGSDELGSTIDLSDFPEFANLSDVADVNREDDGDAFGDTVVIDNIGDDEEEENKIDDFDMNILLGLGMEDKLEETIGLDKVDKIVEKQQGDIKKSENLNRERAALDYEYTNKSQTREVMEAYKSSHRIGRIKLIVSAVLTLILFFFECHDSLGIELKGAFDPTVYPVVYIMFNFQLLLLIAAGGLKSAYNGITNFFRGKPSPESIAGFALIIDIFYNIVISFSDTFGDIGPVTFNLPVAICFLLMYAYDIINLRREIYSFRIVSSKKPKYTLRNLSMADSGLEHEAFSDMMDEDDDAEDISVLRVECTDFVNDYFLRTNRYPNGRRFIGFIVPAAIIVAVAFFAYKYSGNSVFYDGMKAALAAVTTCLPVSVFYMFSHPFYRANETAYAEDSTIVGEESAEEYAEAAIISFDDRNVFPSTGVNVRGINVFGDNRIDHVLYYAASVFCTIGGPLSDVFDLATRDIGHSEDVILMQSKPGLLEAEVDGQNVAFGTLSALAKTGITIPPALAERAEERFESNVSVMYMTKNGKFISRMLISYNIDTDFEFILKQLDKNGMFVGIKTFDPNITEDFISAQLDLTAYPVRVIRCKSLNDRTQLTDHSASGIVSRDTPKSALQTVTLCEKVLRIRSIDTMLVIISLFVSLVISALGIIFGAIGLSPLFITLYQLFWIIPMWVITKLMI